MWTKAFWKGLGERAIKTFFQSFVAATAVVGVTSGSSGLGDVPWLTVASIAGLATFLSAATSIGNADFTAGPAKATVTLGDGQKVSGTLK